MKWLKTKSEMFRSPWMLVMLISISMCILGCSGDHTDTVSKSLAGEEIELTYYYMHSDVEEKETFFNDYAPLINKKYPHITFNFMQNVKGTTLEDIVATKTKIDFFGSTVTGISNLKDVGMLGDVTDLVKVHKVDINRMEPVTIEAMKLTGGGISGFPLKIISGSLFYNKDLFDKFGVQYLTDDTTWEEVIEMARKLTRTEGGVSYYGIGLYPNYLLLSSDGALPLMDEKTKTPLLNMDYWKQKFDRLLPLAMIPTDAEERSTLSNYSQAFRQFYTDRNIAIQIANNSVYNIIAGNDDGLNWDMATLPSFSDLPKAGPQANPYYYIVSSNSPHREATFLALCTLISDESQLSIARKGNVPAMKDKKSYMDIIGTEQPALQGKNAKGLVPRQYADYVVRDKYVNVVISQVVSAFNDVVASKKDANTALRDAQEAATQKINEILSQ